MMVSIQPKQENGLRDNLQDAHNEALRCFNPAEAREWFKRGCCYCSAGSKSGFNPAEAREWFKRVMTRSK